MKEEKEIWIFLSHSSKDYNKVRQIRNYLEERSFRPLMFYLKCLNNREEILNLIKREIDVRTRFILCDSVNARKSEWVSDEMKYISSKNPPRSYLRVDLSESDEKIHRQLDLYMNQMNIYISCSRMQKELFDKICSRLNKYDIRVLPNYESFSGCVFAEEIKKQISHAANNGYFVFLYSKDIINSSFAAEELKLADKLGANVILIALDQESIHLCNNDCSIGRYPYIDMSKYTDIDKANAVTNCILDKILPVGGLMTFADNFRTGKLGVKDEEEAHKLCEYLKSKAEESDNPYALQYLGRCYEYGWLGEVNLKKASMFYSMAMHEPGGPNDECFLQHVKELNEKILDDRTSRKRRALAFLKRVICGVKTHL